MYFVFCCLVTFILEFSSPIAPPPVLSRSCRQFCTDSLFMSRSDVFMVIFLTVIDRAVLVFLNTYSALKNISSGPLASLAAPPFFLVSMTLLVSVLLAYLSSTTIISNTQSVNAMSPLNTDAYPLTNSKISGFTVQFLKKMKTQMIIITQIRVEIP